MSVKLAKPPVYYALAQVKFNPVALMPKFAGEIQDRLRRSGFPIFESEQSQSIDFGDLSQIHETKPTITETPNWFFTSEDKFSGYVLGNDFFTFQVTKYTGHHDFFERFMIGLSLLNEIVSIGAFSRLGIRYLNAVVPDHDESLNQYLHQQVQGVEFGSPWIGGAWESGYKTNLGILVAKIYKTNKSLIGFPVDVQPRSVILDKRFVLSEPKEHAVIDIDHFIQESISYSPGVLRERLNGLHSPVEKCFKAIVTEHAITRWH